MKVLVLGGTVFLSAAVARDFLDRGHEVTCLSRSSTTTVAPCARHVRADRSSGRSAYDEVRAEWDTVIEVATDPRVVRDALDVLGERARHWTYVSSCSVYQNQDDADCDESQAVIEPLADSLTSEPANYGASKSRCESLCTEALGARALVVRPGLIVGSNDPSDRGGYWPARFDRGDPEVLVPEARDLWSQEIDVRDLSRWIVHCAEEGITGVMNAVGESLPLARVIERISRVANFTGSMLVAPDPWLVDQGVEPWAGPESLPLWIPLASGYDGFCRRSNVRAVQSGLRLRPLEETWADCLDFERFLGINRSRRAGLSALRETHLRELLRTGH